jgi:endonuclease YncB( thermonuclease family)
LERKSVNHELVRAGRAWWYRKYCPAAKELKELEQQAREAKRGLFSDQGAKPPWEK